MSFEISSGQPAEAPGAGGADRPDPTEWPVDVTDPGDGDPATEPAPRPVAWYRRLRPRTITLVAAATATLASGAVLFTMPVPYILETPGPTYDTLGSDNGTELIQIEQEPSHEITGQLRLTTVGAFGTDPGSLSLFDLVTGYFDKEDALVPYDLIYPRHSSAEEREAQSAAQMVSSQDAAAAAAFEYLNLKVSVLVAEPQSEAAKAVLEPADELLRVNGQAIENFGALKQIMDQVAAGSEVELEISRDGATKTVSLMTVESDEGKAMLGITVEFRFPVEVKFGLENIGGPSAGSMFALGIIDKLGPDDLAGGRVIAGTGTVDADGTIGPIGGIRQKMVGAKRDGAEVFLAPIANCEEAAGHEPDGLRVVAVSSLDDAVAALAALRSGEADQLSGCSG
ncbi:MAG: PDZ domain-containing protein [Bifidobacteriaceae bacterium]|nr:PDZ domain-containing protein [Bifidobacteriaceae bacterium]